jgi:hypothetical protein
VTGRRSRERGQARRRRAPVPCVHARPRARPSGRLDREPPDAAPLQLQMAALTATQALDPAALTATCSTRDSDGPLRRLTRPHSGE